ncbi:uncharacterized protein LOC141640145 [Silene latifolia]|uniref:uncharacterized protein LOC141640145 n=1 Tax=Silene latifolia TaxID=37657 RepID=UPI003D775229
MRAAQDHHKSYADLEKEWYRVYSWGQSFAESVANESCYAIWKERQAEPEIYRTLRKYVSDPSHILEPETVEMDELQTYMEVAKEILNMKVHKTRNGEIVLVKVLWSNHNVEEATWEAEDSMNEKYPRLFDQV